MTLILFASVVPEVAVASSTFQGSAGSPQSLGPLNMDFPQWNSHSTMEELSLSCQIPATVSTCTHPQAPTAVLFFQEGFWEMLVCFRFRCLVMWWTWRSSASGGRSWFTPSSASGETPVVPGGPHTSCGATRAEKAVYPSTSGSRSSPPGSQPRRCTWRWSQPWRRRNPSFTCQPTSWTLLWRRSNATTYTESITLAMPRISDCVVYRTWHRTCTPKTSHFISFFKCVWHMAVKILIALCLLVFVVFYVYFIRSDLSQCRFWLFLRFPLVVCFVALFGNKCQLILTLLMFYLNASQSSLWEGGRKG